MGNGPVALANLSKGKQNKEQFRSRSTHPGIGIWEAADCLKAAKEKVV